MRRPGREGVPHAHDRRLHRHSGQSVTLPEPPTGDIDRELNFSTPAVEVGRRSILTFKVNPDGDVSYEMTLNGTTILTHRLTTAATRVMQEVIDSDILSADNNELVVTRTVGPGSVSLSDMVVHFQANI